MIDIKDIKPGDTITLEHPDGSRLMNCTVVEFGPEAGILWPFFKTETWLGALLDDGWTLTDHKPKVVLPTRPGWYMRAQDSFGDTDATLYALSGDGEWTTDGSLRWKPIGPADLPTDLVRLVPEVQP